MAKSSKDAMDFFSAFYSVKTFCGLLSPGFCMFFFQFGVVGKSEDGWLCLESLL